MNNSRLRSLMLLIAFLESYATICVERGVYFFTQHELGFTDNANLWLALFFGVFYVVGAMSSHALAGKLGERLFLQLTLLGQLAVHVAMATVPNAVVVFGGGVAIGWLNGMKWPLIESFVNAGLTPMEQSRAVGKFNIAWASTVPVSLMTAGPLIAFAPRWLFILPAIINIACVALTMAAPRRPAHLSADHPQRPDESTLKRLGCMLTASRLLMLSSYALLWVLAALTPRVFSDLGYGVSASTNLSAVLDFVRLAAFVLLGRWVWWHGRRGPLWWSMLGLPVGFVLVLAGGSTAAVLAGEVIFGLSAGMTYYSSLYYAMVQKNAAVEAGGAHEGLIGAGFAIGPAAALAGGLFSGAVGGPTMAATIGVAPIVIACSAAACVLLVRTLRLDRTAT